jgi:NTE family protein
MAARAALEAIQPDAKRDDVLSDIVRQADFEVLGPVVAAIMAGGEPDQTRRAELGAIALRSPHPEAVYVEVVRRFLPAAPWPERLVLTAVAVDDGAFVSWGARDGIGLAEAAAASSAVPGMFPPITIDSRRYMDGGMRSVTSADLAEGSDVVVIVAAPSRNELTDRQIADETAAIREAGGSIVEIRPDAASAEAFGEDPMDGSRQALVFEEGRRQGRAIADRVSAALDPAPTG